MKIRNILVIASLSLIMLFSACSKDDVNNKLVGTWNQISVGQIPEGTKIVWTIEDDNSIKMTKYQNGNLTKTAEANWELKMRFAKKSQLEITDYDNTFDGIDRNGTYTIHELDDHLKILRVEADSPAPYLWMEFKKQ